MNYLASLIAAGAFALSAGGVSAATITFGDYTSTNADSLSPLVTVNDDTPGSFLVTVTHVAPSNGSLNLIAFDLGAASFSSTDIFDVSNGGTALTFQSPCTNTGTTQVSSGNYCVGSSVPLGGNSNNLNPFDTTPFDLVLAFYNNDGVGRLESPLTFRISDQGGTLTLDNFLAVGLRFQSANNDEGSDKLVGTPVTPPEVIPLPAAGWLLIGGLAGLAAMKRRRRAA
jgi:hypothetical protein